MSEITPEQLKLLDTGNFTLDVQNFVTMYPDVTDIIRSWCRSMTAIDMGMIVIMFISLIWILRNNYKYFKYGVGDLSFILRWNFIVICYAIGISLRMMIFYIF